MGTAKDETRGACRSMCAPMARCKGAEARSNGIRRGVISVLDRFRRLLLTSSNALSFGVQSRINTTFYKGMA
jgi:hypothetical protein